MNYDEMIFQLRDLKHDKEKYIDKDDPEDIIKKDVDALEIALNYLTSNDLIKEKEYSEKIIKLQEEQIELYKKYVKDLEDLYHG